LLLGVTHERPSGDPAQIDYFVTVFLLFILVVYVTMVYAPIAAWLVEMFPTRIRYSGLSLPYHIGNGWFGGFLPATVFAIVAATGDIYSGLWYPVVIATMSFFVGLLFLPETKGRRHNQVTLGLWRLPCPSVASSAEGLFCRQLTELPWPRAPANALCRKCTEGWKPSSARGS
jgi:hypothetical protein